MPEFSSTLPTVKIFNGNIPFTVNNIFSFINPSHFFTIETFLYAEKR